MIVIICVKGTQKMRTNDREFIPAKKLVCERYKTPIGTWCEMYTHANELGNAKKRARSMNVLHPGCRAEAYLVSEHPSRFEDNRRR